MQPVKTKKKLSRADKKQIEAAIARANRTDKKGKSAQDSIPYERMWPDGICRVSDSHYTKTIQFQDINYGQPLEKIVGNILKVAVIRPKQRPYQTNNFYAVLKRQEMLDKEVYDIVHRNKKMAASDVRKNRGKNCAAGKDKEKTVPRR